MKLAFVTNIFREDSFDNNNEKLIYKLVKNAINDGYEVDLYCVSYQHSSHNPELKFNKKVVFGGASDCREPKKLEALFDAYKNMIGTEKYDQVISTGYTPPLDVAILFEHSLKHRFLSGNIAAKAAYAIKNSKRQKYQQKWIINGYNKMFVPSNTLKWEISENFNIPEKKFFVLYPAVDIPENITGIDIESIKSGTKPFTFGLLANNFEKEGGVVFLKALKLLKKQEKRFKAVIVCPKSKNNLVLKSFLLANGLNKYVEVVSDIDNKEDFYTSVDSVVMTSGIEPFGITALEAMAYQRVPIINSNDGASEIIKDGVEGFIYNAKQQAVKNLANAMVYVIDHPEDVEGISKNALKLAKTFTWERVYNDFISNLPCNRKDDFLY